MTSSHGSITGPPVTGQTWSRPGIWSRHVIKPWQNSELRCNLIFQSFINSIIRTPHPSVLQHPSTLSSNAISSYHRARPDWLRTIRDPCDQPPVEAEVVAIWRWGKALGSWATGLLEVIMSLMTRCMSSWTQQARLSGG